MQNRDLIGDYLKRSKARLKAIQVLYDEESYSDVVRESQELVELVFKAYLRHKNIEAPRIHDVSPIIEQNWNIFTDDEKKFLKKFMKYSKELRRDRELAFYGSEDLTPSEFYKVEDANEAKARAEEVYKVLSEAITVK